MCPRCFPLSIPQAQGEYFPGDEGEKTRRRRLRINVRPAEEEAGRSEAGSGQLVRTLIVDPLMMYLVIPPSRFAGGVVIIHQGVGRQGGLSL